MPFFHSGDEDREIADLVGLIAFVLCPKSGVATVARRATQCVCRAVQCMHAASSHHIDCGCTKFSDLPQTKRVIISEQHLF